MEHVLTLMTIQEKMYAPLTEDVDTEVSDEEAAQKRIVYVYMSTAGTETDEDGNTVDLTDEEKAAKKQELQDILDAAGEAIPYRLAMMDCVETYREEYAEGMQGGHDHAHDEHGEHDAHEAHDGHLHDGHEEEIEYDEHIWTSPVNAMALCRAICDTLCEADPDNADGYRARLADYLDELQALDETFRDITNHAARRLVVFGDRLPLLYFCREYDLDYRAAFHGCAGDTEPSLATLKYLIDVVEEQEIPVVYTIELSSQKVAQAIAETTGAQVRTFHSCQTVSRAEFDGGATYISLMTANAAALKEGLS